MKVQVNTTFGQEEPLGEWEDAVQTSRSHLPTHPRAEAAVRPDSATQGRGAGAGNHSLAHLEREIVTRFWSKRQQTTL